MKHNELRSLRHCRPILNEPDERWDARLECLVDHEVGELYVRFGLSSSGSGMNPYAPEGATHTGLEPASTLDVAQVIYLEKQWTHPKEFKELTRGLLGAC